MGTATCLLQPCPTCRLLSHTTVRPPPWPSLAGTGKTKTILGLLSIIMHSAPRGAFASAKPGGGGEALGSPTAAEAEAQPSHIKYRRLSAERKRAAWLEANPYLLGVPDPR